MMEWHQVVMLVLVVVGAIMGLAIATSDECDSTGERIAAFLTMLGCVPFLGLGIVAGIGLAYSLWMIFWCNGFECS